MKKFIILILSVLLVTGCTKLPASYETGLNPDEYEKIVNAEEVNKENESLKEELDKTKTELDDLQKEYEKLAKNNNNTMSILEETKTKLNIVESEDIPRFYTEETSIDGIVSYLNDSSKVLANSMKGIEVIKKDEAVIFRTIGFGENYSQIFIWEEGKNEPFLIKDAVLDKNGSYQWLDKYMLIMTNERCKVLDFDGKKVTGTFEHPQKMQFIKDTSTVLLKDKNNEFLLYDFVNDIKKQIQLDNKNYTDFNLINGAFVFTGEYIDDNGIAYEVRASVTEDKMKEIYEIKSNDENIKIIEDEETEDTV